MYYVDIQMALLSSDKRENGKDGIETNYRAKNITFYVCKSICFLVQGLFFFYEIV